MDGIEVLNIKTVMYSKAAFYRKKTEFTQISCNAVKMSFISVTAI